MTQLSVYTRAQQGDLSLLDEIDHFSTDDKKRCVTLAAQFGQIQLLEAWIAQHNIHDFAEHALWVAAHDSQFDAVNLLAPLVPSDNAVWESVLRCAITNKCLALQEKILAFPSIRVESGLLAAAKQGNKPLTERLLKRSTQINAHLVLTMLECGWNDLVTQWVGHLPSAEKNKFFVHCITKNLSEQEEFFEVCKGDLNTPSPNALAAAIVQKNWNLAEQLLPYCDVPMAVKIVNKQSPNTETREQLQRLVLLHEIGNFEAASSSKRKI